MLPVSQLDTTPNPLVHAILVWCTCQIIWYAGSVVGIGTSGVSVWDAALKADAVDYESIATRGYVLRPELRSDIVFPPIFPLVAQSLGSVFSISAATALLVVSVSANAIGVLLFNALLMESPLSRDRQSLSMTIWAIGVGPTTVFWHVCYSESLFALCLVAFLFGIQRRWSVGWLSLISGLATGTRTVGVVLVLPLLLHVWRSSGGWREFVTTCSWMLPLGSSGLLAFMAYQHFAFGDALAFVHNRYYWEFRHVESTWEWVKALVTLEPIWSVYVPSHPAYWAKWDHVSNPLLSLTFANPIYSLFTVAMVVIGAWKKWLNVYEITLSVGLLLIPYVTHSYQFYFQSQGRYASVLLPAYLVMGQLLAKLPTWLAAILLGCSAGMLFLYSALFAAWYRII